MSQNRRYLDKMEYPHPHVGQMVWNVMRQKRMTQAEVARLMNVKPTLVANYLKQPSLQFGILWKLCIAIQYDFLADLKQHYPPTLHAQSEEAEKIKDLEKEIAIYKATLKIDR